MIQVYNNEILDWCESNAPISLKNETRENKAVQLINCYVNNHNVVKRTITNVDIVKCEKVEELSCNDVPVKFIWMPGKYFQMSDGTWRLVVKDTLEYEAYKSFLNRTKEE